MTYIIGKQRNGIILILSKYHIVFHHIAVEGILHIGHIVLQEQLSFFMGNAVFCIIFDLIVRAARAITDGVLLLIPIRILIKALLGLQ